MDLVNHGTMTDTTYSWPRTIWPSRIWSRVRAFDPIIPRYLQYGTGFVLYATGQGPWIPGFWTIFYLHVKPWVTWTLTMTYQDLDYIIPDHRPCFTGLGHILRNTESCVTIMRTRGRATGPWTINYWAVYHDLLRCGPYSTGLVPYSTGPLTIF